MNEAFQETAIERLKNFLHKTNSPSGVEILTPDASTREYFRINWQNRSAIACVYSERFIAEEHSYLDVTALFRAADLPVAEIYSFDEASAIIVLEDFGDTILRDVLIQSGGAKKAQLVNEAISLIAQIQAATESAFKANSIASRLKFDEEKLLWELNFFRTHYFTTLKNQPLAQAENKALNDEFIELAKTLENRAAFLCHRDFHAANLMIDRENRLRIIDHQDARIGTASYDLVSLLLDRVLEIPAEYWLREKKKFLLAERQRLGLKRIEYETFDEEFQLQTIQRCLKAIGTFSFQSAARGKIHFIKFIEPMFQNVLQAAEKLNGYSTLQKIIRENISHDSNLNKNLWV